jgi:hypothetical protein
MSLIKKKDVENYLSVRRHTGIHAMQMAAKLPKATPSVNEVASTKTHERGFASDFSREHSSTGGSVTAVVMITHADDGYASDKPGSSQV